MLLYRIRHNPSGILAARSYCPECKHHLGVFDLIPLLSYVFLKGSCRYCSHPIAKQYFLTELAMASSFTFFGYFYLERFFTFSDPLSWASASIFFICVWGVVSLSVYDIEHLEIADEIVIPTNIILLLLLLGSSFFPHISLFVWQDPVENLSLSPLAEGILASFLIYSFFFIQILVPGISHAIREKKYFIIRELVQLYFFFPFLIVWHFFFPKKQDIFDEEEQIPSWIGWGDLRIAFLMGLFGGISVGLVGLFIAYMLGSIIGIIVIAIKRKRNIPLPFGPFLGYGLLFATLFLTDITAWHKDILYNIF